MTIICERGILELEKPLDPVAGLTSLTLDKFVYGDLDVVQQGFMPAETFLDESPYLVDSGFVDRFEAGGTVLAPGGPEALNQRHFNLEWYIEWKFAGE